MSDEAITVIRFKGKQKDINRVLSRIVNENTYRFTVFEGLTEEEVVKGEPFIDFDLLIPEPKTKEECPEQYLLEDETDQCRWGLPEKPWFNWYDWRRDFWDSKWNAWFSEISDKEISFFSPWSFPDKICSKLCELCIENNVKAKSKCYLFERKRSALYATWKSNKKAKGFMKVKNAFHLNYGFLLKLFKRKEENLEDYVVSDDDFSGPFEDFPGI